MRSRILLLLCLSWTALAPGRTAAQSSPIGSTNLVTVRASDTAFEAPARLQAGWHTFRLENTGEESHHLQVVRLRNGRTFAELEAALEKTPRLPSWAVPVGGPSVTLSGGVTEATVRLNEGQYALLDLLASADGEAHIYQGLLHALRVTEGRAAQPQASLTMTLRNYTFTPSQPLVRGRQTLRVTNSANQPHEMLVFRLEQGKLIGDLTRWLYAPEGTPPGQPIGGTTLVGAGQTVFVHLALEPGSYALICLARDVRDDRPHLEHGMARQFFIR